VNGADPQAPLWAAMRKSRRERRPVVFCTAHHAEMGAAPGCSLEQQECRMSAIDIEETPAAPLGFRRRGRCVCCSGPLYYAGTGRPPRFCRRTVCQRRRRDGFAGADPRRRNPAASSRTEVA
jgi:hypothetical protein